MDITLLITISGYVFSVVTGVASWLAGTRSRKNSIYREMLTTIQNLNTQNQELHNTIMGLQDEVIEVRKENAELKVGQANMTRKIEELKAENTELKALVTARNPQQPPKAW